MKYKTAITHWCIFLMLSAVWWFVIPPQAYPLSAEDSFGVKLVVWAVFFAGGILFTRGDDE